MTIIELKDINLNLGSREIFRKLNLEIRQGEKILIRGKSGSGKTSLFRLIQGFVLPGEGEIFVMGNKLDHHSVWKLRRYIAYVAQNTDLGEGKVEEILQNLFTIKGIGRDKPFNDRFFPGIFI